MHKTIVLWLAPSGSILFIVTSLSSHPPLFFSSAKTLVPFTMPVQTPVYRRQERESDVVRLTTSLSFLLLSDLDNLLLEATSPHCPLNYLNDLIQLCLVSGKRENTSRTTLTRRNQKYCLSISPFSSIFCNVNAKCSLITHAIFFIPGVALLLLLITTLSKGLRGMSIWIWRWSPFDKYYLARRKRCISTMRTDSTHNIKLKTHRHDAMGHPPVCCMFLVDNVFAHPGEGCSPQ